MRIGHKRDPFRSNMRVEVVYENESLIFESEVPTTISTILNELDIPSSTVLAVYNDTIVPHSSTISEDIKIVFPIHPRTANMIEKFGLQSRINQIPNLVLTKPLGYLDFLALIKHSKVVLTDSGGLQEETTSLGIPCITLRDNTERPITIEQGTNVLVGNKTEKITIEWKNICRNGGKSGRIPELWDGKTSERITNAIVDFLK